MWILQKISKIECSNLFNKKSIKLIIRFLMIKICSKWLFPIQIERPNSISIETHAKESSNAKIRTVQKHGVLNVSMLSYGLKVILNKWEISFKHMRMEIDVKYTTMFKFLGKDAKLVFKRDTHIHSFYLISNKGSQLISQILLREMFLIFLDLKNQANISIY